MSEKQNIKSFLLGLSLPSRDLAFYGRGVDNLDDQTAERVAAGLRHALKSAEHAVANLPNFQKEEAVELKSSASKSSLNRFEPKISEESKKWVIIDADGVVLGRLASIVSMRLRGKHLTTYTPNMGDGENVVVINADKVKLAGHKLTNKFYWNASRLAASKKQIFGGRSTEGIIVKAVERLISRGSSSRAKMKNLRVYAGSEHPHTGQEIEVINISAIAQKNKRSA